MVVIGSGICAFILMVVLAGVLFNDTTIFPEGENLCPPGPFAEKFSGKMKCG